MVKIILSPAKLQDFSVPPLSIKRTTPQFIAEAKEVAQTLNHLSQDEIASLMKVSETIAETTKASFEQWGRKSVTSCALYAYRGEVFKCFHEVPLSEGELAKATETLRVLSAVYGMLRPTDTIEPYRLEVKTTVTVNAHKNLYSFWKSLVTEALVADLIEGELLVNLASTEYAKMIDWKKISNPVITPQFKVIKEGKIKTAAVWAKKARGYFARFLLQEKTVAMEYMKTFNVQGFSFSSFDEKSGEILFLKEL